MDTPFAENIVGSWLIVKSNRTPQWIEGDTVTEYEPRSIYHFTSDHKCHLEMDDPQGRRILYRNAYGYKIHGPILTIIYKSGANRKIKSDEHKMTLGEDGLVQWLHEPSGRTSWAARLTHAEPYSRFFVSDEGKLIESLG